MTKVARVNASAPGVVTKGTHRNRAVISVGVIVVETSLAQAPLTTAAMVDGGLTTRVERDDDLGGCVAIGTRPVSSRPPAGAPG